MMRASHHTRFAMDDPSCVGEARRHASMLAQRCGMSEVEVGRVAIVVTELGNNLVRHAQRGVLLIAPREQSGDVEIVSMDHGPGIADVARSLGDGFSTGGTPGTGLGAVKRLARTFDMHSTVPDGTVIVARVGAAGSATPTPSLAVCSAGISLPLAGELVCGDAWAMASEGSIATVMVADGLGHGPDAAEASSAAVDVFLAHPMEEPTRLLATMHERLRSTRGAAVTIIRLDTVKSTVRACGAGNVTARLVSGASDRTLVMQHGTAGVQIRRPEEVMLAWPEHALLIIYSDGIETRWNPERLMPVLGRDPALAAAILMRDHSRGRDDSTVAVVRRRA
jgi:anti-sigma regulatory factor (Ser/Thr protein kinase)